MVIPTYLGRKQGRIEACGRGRRPPVQEGPSTELGGRNPESMLLCWSYIVCVRACVYIIVHVCMSTHLNLETYFFPLHSTFFTGQD